MNNAFSRNFLSFRFKEHPPAIEFCPSKQNEPSSNVIEVESESPTEPLDGLDEALMTSTEEAASNEDANNDKIDSGEKATTNSIEVKATVEIWSHIEFSI